MGGFELGWGGALPFFRGCSCTKPYETQSLQIIKLGFHPHAKPEEGVLRIAKLLPGLRRRYVYTTLIVYIYIYINKYVCIHIYIYIYIYMCIHTYLFIYIYIYTISVVYTYLLRSPGRSLAIRRTPSSGFAWGWKPSFMI